MLHSDQLRLMEFFSGHHPTFEIEIKSAALDCANRIEKFTIEGRVQTYISGNLNV